MPDRATELTVAAKAALRRRRVAPNRLQDSARSAFVVQKPIRFYIFPYVQNLSIKILVIDENQIGASIDRPGGPTNDNATQRLLLARSNGAAATL
jgi:hypothetical protein